MRNYDIVIIGAGSVGTPLSYYLACKGYKVAVIDSRASVGQGQNKAAIGGIRATHSDPAKIFICQESLKLIPAIKEEHGIDVSWYKGGYLFPVYTTDHETALKKLLKTQKGFDLNIDWLNAAGIAQLAPGINPNGLRGGTYSPDDGSANPLRVAGAYYRLARNKGVHFKFYETALSAKTSNGVISSVKTNKADYSADLIINAAGANAREVGQLFAVDIPVYPDSHEAGITEPVQRFFEPMIVDLRSDAHSTNYYFYQYKEGQIVFCITPNPKYPGKDVDNTSSFLPLVLRRMISLYPRLRSLRVRRTWRGLYPMTPDGFPIVGFDKEHENLLHLVGMCGQGFMLGAGLGKIMAEYLNGNKDPYKFILKQLSLYRDFSGTEVLK